MDRLLNMHKIMKIIRLSRGGMERVPWSNRTFSSLCTRHPSGCGTTTSTVPTRFPHSSHRQALARHTSATADSLNKHRDNVTVTRSCEMTQGHAVPVPHCITTNSNTGIRCIGNNSIPYIRGCLSFRVPGLGIVHQPSVDRQYFTGSQRRKWLRQFWKTIQSVALLLDRCGLHQVSQLLSCGSNRFPNECVRHFSSTPRQSQQQPQQEGDGEKSQEQEDPEDGEKTPFSALLVVSLWMMFLMYVILKLRTGDDDSNYKFVSWTEFVKDMLSKGEVDEVMVRPEMEMAFIRLQPGAVIRGTKLDSQVFVLKVLEPHKFEDKVREAEAELGIKPENGVPIYFERMSELTSFVFKAAIFLTVLLILRNLISVQLPNPTDMFSSYRKAKFVRVDLQKGKGISFKDVAGLQEAKVEVMEFVDYLKRPQRYKELGAKIPKGSLLLGPPGCGKTLLAKAVATEAEVPFLAMAGSEFVEMLGGLGAARVRDLFKEARQKSPCIVYIDEIDAIGRKRSGGVDFGQSEDEHTLNQLLVEMDGIGTSQGVIVMGSTNRADILDKALLRAGRFDRHIMIDFPTLPERTEIFDMYLQKLKLKHPPKHYSERLAQLSPGRSGADIANICNEAALHAARDGKKAVDSEDFDYAVERVSAGVAKKSRVLSPQEKKVVAYHEAGHAVVGWLLEHTDALLRVSIVPRTNATLGVAQYMPQDKKLYSKEELFQRMCMSLGGRVAESLTFNSVTSGAEDDLRKVTKLAYSQVQQLGMNENVGLVSFPETDSGFGSKPYSKQTAHIIDQEARKLVAQVYTHTEELLKQNKEKLRVIAEALLEKEALTYKDMEQLIGPSPFANKRAMSVDWDVAGTPAT